MKKLKEEIEIEDNIKEGKDIEITEAINILTMIKNNIPMEEISKETGKSISDIKHLISLFKS